jgi:membrane protease YdiL (CAAX protease family)
MGDEFLDNARRGNSRWWAYLLGILVILFVWFVIGSLPILLALGYLLMDGDPATGVDPETSMLVGIDPLYNFLLLMASFVMLLAGIAFAVIVIHRRSLKSLVTPGKAIRWGRLGQGALLWFGLIAASSLVEALLFPGRYRLDFDPVRFIPFAIATLVLIPIQTSAEELLTRGYLLQALGLLTRNRWLLSLVVGFLFTLPHLANPEVELNFWAVTIYYFLFGAFLAWVTLRDNGLELALGVHAANNLFIGLLANFPGSALPTPAVFTLAEVDPVFNLVASVATAILFYLLMFGFRGKGLRPVERGQTSADER